MINIDRLSKEGAAQYVCEICEGLQDFVNNNPDQAKELLKRMINSFLQDMSDEDFFGTEGWERGLNVD